MTSPGVITQFKPRWPTALACLCLVLFMQLGVATHHHDEPGHKPHECATCPQLQILQHGTVASINLPAVVPVHLNLTPSSTPVYRQVHHLTPPARAPPLV